MNVTCNVTDELSVRARALTGREAPRKEEWSWPVRFVTPCLAQLPLKGDRKEYIWREISSRTSCAGEDSGLQTP